MKIIKTVGPTILSGVTSVKVGGANFKLPADAKCILAIVPQVTSPAGLTAGIAVLASVELKSDSNPISPFKVLCAPIGSTLGKAGVAVQDHAPIYPVNCPVKGGSEIEIWATALHTHTIEPYVTCDIIISDFVASPQFKAKLGTLTATGTAAGETKGSGLRLEGARRIVELLGIAVGTTVATLKGICGKFRLSSSGLKAMGDQEFALEHIGGAVSLDATTATSIEFALLTRKSDLDIPVTDPIDIDDYFNLGVAITTAGKFIVGILYI